MTSFEVSEMAQPIKKFRAGSISCALFENDIQVNGQAKTILKATVARRYKDQDGNWKSSGSFSRNEAFLAIWCLQRALDAMIEEQNSGGNGELDVPVEDVSS